MPALTAEREVIAVDLPGFGQSPPLAGPVTVATLTDAVQEFMQGENLGRAHRDADLTGTGCESGEPRWQEPMPFRTSSRQKPFCRGFT